MCLTLGLCRHNRLVLGGEIGPVCLKLGVDTTGWHWVGRKALCVSHLVCVDTLGWRWVGRKALCVSNLV